MKIVIDIPEEVYKSIQDNEYCGISNADMYNAVKNGTPLPKVTINTNEVLGKIRADIEALKNAPPCFDDMFEYKCAVDDVLAITDKYKAESEDNE